MLILLFFVTFDFYRSINEIYGVPVRFKLPGEAGKRKLFFIELRFNPELIMFTFFQTIKRSDSQKKKD